MFSPLFLVILALQPILFHIIPVEGHYMLCSIEENFLKKKKKRRAELFDYGVATVVSNVTQMLHGVHGDGTTNVYRMFC